MQNKEHYKMYKSGKMWVAALAATAVFAGVQSLENNTKANADTVSSSASTSNSGSQSGSQAGSQSTSTVSTSAQSGSTTSTSAVSNSASGSVTSNSSASSVDSEGISTRLGDDSSSTSTSQSAQVQADSQAVTSTSQALSQAQAAVDSASATVTAAQAKVNADQNVSATYPVPTQPAPSLANTVPTAGAGQVVAWNTATNQFQVADDSGWRYTEDGYLQVPQKYFNALSQIQQIEAVDQYGNVVKSAMNPYSIGYAYPYGKMVNGQLLVTYRGTISNNANSQEMANISDFQADTSNGGSQFNLNKTQDSTRTPVQGLTEKGTDPLPSGTISPTFDSNGFTYTYNLDSSSTPNANNLPTSFTGSNGHYYVATATSYSGNIFQDLNASSYSLLPQVKYIDVTQQIADNKTALANAQATLTTAQASLPAAQLALAQAKQVYDQDTQSKTEQIAIQNVNIVDGSNQNSLGTLDVVTTYTYNSGDNSWTPTQAIYGSGTQYYSLVKTLSKVSGNSDLTHVPIQTTIGNNGNDTRIGINGSYYTYSSNTGLFDSNGNYTYINLMNGQIVKGINNFTITLFPYVNEAGKTFSLYAVPKYETFYATPDNVNLASPVFNFSSDTPSAILNIPGYTYVSSKYYPIYGYIPAGTSYYYVRNASVVSVDQNGNQITETPQSNTNQQLNYTDASGKSQSTTLPVYSGYRFVSADKIGQADDGRPVLTLHYKAIGQVQTNDVTVNLAIKDQHGNLIQTVPITTTIPMSPIDQNGNQELAFAQNASNPGNQSNFSSEALIPNTKVTTKIGNIFVTTQAYEIPDNNGNPQYGIGIVNITGPSDKSSISNMSFISPVIGTYNQITNYANKTQGYNIFSVQGQDGNIQQAATDIDSTNGYYVANGITPEDAATNPENWAGGPAPVQMLPEDYVRGNTDKAYNTMTMTLQTSGADTTTYNTNYVDQDGNQIASPVTNYSNTGVHDNVWGTKQAVDGYTYQSTTTSSDGLTKTFVYQKDQKVIDDTNNKLNQANQSLQDTTNKLNQANQMLQQTQQALQDETGKYNQSQSDLATANQNLASKQAALDTANQNLATTKANLDQANQDLTNTKQALSDETGKYNQSQADLATANQKINDLENQLAALQAKYNQSQSDLVAAQKNLTDTTNALNTANQNLTNMQQALTDETNKYNQSQSDLAKAQQAQQAAETAKTQADQNAADATAKANQAEADKEAAQQAAQEANTKAQQAQADASVSDSAKAQAQQEAQTAQQAQATAEQNAKDAETARDKAIAQQQATQSDYENTLNALNTAQANLATALQNLKDATQAEADAKAEAQKSDDAKTQAEAQIKVAQDAETQAKTNLANKQVELNQAKQARATAEKNAEDATAAKQQAEADMKTAQTNQAQAESERDQAIAAQKQAAVEESIAEAKAAKADTDAQNAIDAKNAAEKAQAEAEQKQHDAETARDQALEAKTQAETKQADAEAQAKQATADREAMETQLQAAIKAQGEAEQKAKDAEATAQKALADQVTAQQQAEQAKQAQAKAETERDEITTQAKQLAEDLDKVQAKYNKSRSQVASEAKLITQQSQTIQSQNDDLATTKAQLKQATDDLHTAQANAEKSVQDAKNAELKQKSAEETAQKALDAQRTAEAEAKQAQADKVLAQKNEAEAKASEKDALDKLAKVQAENEALVKENKDLKSKNAEQTSKLSADDDLIARLQAEIESLKKNQSSLEDKNASLTKENTDLKAENETLKSENAQLKSDLTTSQAQTKEYKNARDEAVVKADNHQYQAEQATQLAEDYKQQLNAQQTVKTVEAKAPQTAEKAPENDALMALALASTTTALALAGLKKKNA